MAKDRARIAEGQGSEFQFDLSQHFPSTGYQSVEGAAWEVLAHSLFYLLELGVFVPWHRHSGGINNWLRHWTEYYPWALSTP